MRCRIMGWLSGALAMVAVGCGEAPAPKATADEKSSEVKTASREAIEPVPVDSVATSSETVSDEETPADLAFAKLLAATDAADPDAWSEADQQLLELGSQAVPTLARYLQHADSLARELSVQYLAQLGPAAIGAESALTQALADDSSMVRVNAAAALLAMNASSTEAVAALKTMLNDDNPSVRLPAAISLAGMSTTMNDAIPVLTGLLTDGEPTIRLTAVETLGRLGSKAKASLAAVQELTSDSNDEVRAAAREAVKDIESSASPSDTIPVSGEQ